LHQGH